MYFRNQVLDQPEWQALLTIPKIYHLKTRFLIDGKDEVVK